MSSKVFSAEYAIPELSLMERILPWTSAGQISRAVRAKPDKLSAVTVEKKSEYKQTAPSAVVETETKMKTGPDVAEKIRSYAAATSPATFEDAVSDNQNTTMLEMWNLIESVGIRRDNLDRVFRTDEAAVSELYSLVEKRLHRQREQDMIRKLKAHVEKMVKSKIDTKITP